MLRTYKQNCTALHILIRTLELDWFDFYKFNILKLFVVKMYSHFIEKSLTNNFKTFEEFSMNWKVLNECHVQVSDI